MSLSDFSIKNPVFAVMLSAAMVVFGYLGYKDLGISQFPELDFPVVSITTYLDAAAPETMDVDVTDILEDAVSSVEGIDYIQSQSLQGVAVSTIFFHLHRDIDVAMQDVQNAVAAAASRLPNDIDPPIISKVNFNKFPVLWLAVHGNKPMHDLNQFVDDNLKQIVQTIPGGGLSPATTACRTSASASCGRPGRTSCRYVTRSSGASPNCASWPLRASRFRSRPTIRSSSRTTSPRCRRRCFWASCSRQW